MKIILISGKAQNGKDTTANILKEKLEQKNNKVLITHFGDLVKFICEKYFDWDGQKDERGRAILQRIGTNVIREQNPDYWVDFVINLLSILEEEGKWDYVLIPDARFHNEIQKFEDKKDWDVVSVRVNRLNFTSTLTQEQKNHPSETALDDYVFDYVIYAENGIDKLEIEVDKFINWLEGINN